MNSTPTTPLLTALWKRHGLFFGAGTLCVLVNMRGIGPLWWTGVVLLSIGGTMRWSLARQQRPPYESPSIALRVPVDGRWVALNGPATKVPSHTHSHAQTYAIDLKHAPPADAPADPAFRVLWPLGRRPQGYATFGRPVLAPADAVVVATTAGQRDHLTRMSLPAFGFLYLEGFVRGLGWPRHIWGNHILLDLGDGVYAGFAHLRRGSLQVAVGDRVRAGQKMAECGNSGNSSEPHLHFQLMDGPDVMTAHGLPFTWDYRVDEGGAEAAPRTGVPKDGTFFVTLENRTSPRGADT
ncbi:M23 family metallopeptidase [Streptomyces sp. NPDC059255]|uniref:M23 family metallopeptidase n=1 Tax=Streptomyces sp. NPDC059255 TaxID=3346793 RepID=UPI00367C332D